MISEASLGGDLHISMNLRRRHRSEVSMPVTIADAIACADRPGSVSDKHLTVGLFATAENI